jgi:hypothetical protein
VSGPRIKLWGAVQHFAPTELGSELATSCYKHSTPNGVHHGLFRKAWRTGLLRTLAHFLNDLARNETNNFDKP